MAKIQQYSATVRAISAPDRFTAPAMTLVFVFLSLGALLAAFVGLAKDPSLGAVAITLGYALLVPVIVAASRDGPQRWLWIGIVITSAIAVRIGSLDLIGTAQLGADPMNYSNIARAILDGRGMITDDFRYGQGLRAYFPPLYPIILSGWWWVFGDSLWATLLLNLATALTTCWALASIGKRLGQAEAGRAAALIFLAYPAFAITAGVPNKEMQTMLLGALFVRAILMWEADGGERPWRHAAIFGILWALMALTQAALALMPPVVAAILIPRYGFTRLLGLGLRAIPFFVIVMAPWWIRNWLIFGQFVPFTTAAGFMLNVMLGEAKVPFPADIFTMPEPDRSGRIAGLALARIAEVPGEWIKNVISAFASGFGYEEGSISAYRHMTPPISPQDRNMLTPPLQFAWAAILGGAALACRRIWREGRVDPVVSISLALLASICLINMWFEFGERHRYQLTPLIMLLAGTWLVRKRSGSIRQP
jgi:4-amino-4-deoxy-L-arabinose transferase-like glycosyltransferase